jgi:hypothetical protein
MRRLRISSWRSNAANRRVGTPIADGWIRGGYELCGRRPLTAPYRLTPTVTRSQRARRVLDVALAHGRRRRKHPGPEWAVQHVAPRHRPGLRVATSAIARGVR